MEQTKRLVLLSTIYCAILAVEKVLKTVNLSTYERYRLEDALFYLEGIYRERKRNKKIDC